MKIIGALVLLLISGVAFAAKNVATADKNQKDEKQNESSSRSHNFEDVLVQGKYHFSDEAVTTVEADKVFESLIGVRTDFKDRLEQSANKQ